MTSDTSDNTDSSSGNIDESTIITESKKYFNTYSSIVIPPLMSNNDALYYVDKPVAFLKALTEDYEDAIDATKVDKAHRKSMEQSFANRKIRSITSALKSRKRVAEDFWR